MLVSTLKNYFLGKTEYLKPKTIANSWTLEIVHALKAGDTEKLRKLFTSFMEDIPYSMRRKEDERERERYFHLLVSAKNS